MPRITLPDGSIRHFDGPVTGADIAASIGKGLAKAALAIRVDGTVRDLATTIEADASVAIVTRDSEEALELLRHDAAHVLAEAVKELWPETQITIGPAIENGFYYDFAREQPFTPEDLERMEERMREIVDRDEPISREVWDRDEAVRFFREWGEDVQGGDHRGDPERRARLAVPPGRVDRSLSRTPPPLHRQARQGVQADAHLRRVLARRLRRTRCSSGSTAPRGRTRSSSRPTCTCWRRRSGATIAGSGARWDLFHFQDESPGAVFWHPNGQRLLQSLIRYIRERQTAAGYVEVNTPEIMDRSLWEASGHWEAFRENMFTSETEDGRVFALKPMNCPGHVQIYRNGPVRSHRSLPMRIAEFGKVHRYEPSGALHGLMRVRAFIQDDAHVFCATDQITQESIAMCDLILSIYRDFGFEDVRIKFADRPETRVGADEVWDKAEAALRVAIDSTGLEYTHNPGEGAFYGPEARSSCCATPSAETGSAAPCRSTSTFRVGSGRPTSARTASATCR